MPRASVTDVSERRRDKERLRESRDALRSLSARLQAVREEESARIAREVHDGVGQLLTALRLDLAWLERALRGTGKPLGEELTEKLSSMALLLDAAADSLNHVMSELRPGVLDELGLAAAVEWCARDFAKRSAISSLRLRSDLGSAALDPETSTALFRILQEALTNVARHSGATAVEIRLAAEDGGVLLEVGDNGSGIPDEKLDDSRSLGLLGMRERARSLGGELVARRGAVRGTTVRVTIPPRRSLGLWPSTPGGS